MLEIIYEKCSILLLVGTMLGTYRYVLGLSLEQGKRMIPYVIGGLVVVDFLLPYNDEGIALGGVVALLGIRSVLFCTVKKRRYIHSLIVYPIFCIVGLPVLLLELVTQACFGFSFIDSTKIWANLLLDLVPIAILCILGYCEYKWNYTKWIDRRERFLIEGMSVVIIAGSMMLLEANLATRLKNGHGRVILLASCIMFCALLLTVVLVIAKGYKAGHYKEVSEQNERYMAELLKHFEAYQVAQKETRRLRHDMKNHLTCIRLLLEEGREEELKTYLDEITEASNRLSFDIFTGNTMVDAILCEKESIVKEEGIKFEVEGMFPPSVAMRPVDCCTIFANAVDNAIEAVRKLTGEKLVRIRLASNQQFFSIKFTNLCAHKVEDVDGKIRSTKRDKLYHGFGIENMRRAVANYEGDVRIRCTRAEELYEYELQLLLPLSVLHSSQNFNRLSQKEHSKKQGDILSDRKGNKGDETMEYLNPGYELKQTKKQMSKVGRMVSLYTLSMLVGSVVYIVGYLVAYLIKHPEIKHMTEHQMQEISDKIGAGGGMYLFSVPIAFLVILLHRKKQLFTHDLVVKNKSMNGRTLAIAAICMMAVQFMCGICSMGAEAGLNQFGYTIMKEVDAASAQSVTISMYLYAGILGPIVEELIFRGAVLRSLEKYGKVFAIVVSSILFGLFHGNLIQGIFAVLVGLVLAYVTEEYSIKWAILLHIVNNTVSDLDGLFVKILGENVATFINITVLTVAFIIAMIYLIRNRKNIKEYRMEHPTIEKSYRYMFTRIWVILFIVAEVFLAIGGIEKL